MNSKIVYTEFTAVVRKQKEILKKLIERKQNQIRKVHPGLTCFRDGIREIPVESIPGILEAGYVPPANDRGGRNTRNSDDPEQLTSVFRTILTGVKNQSICLAFSHPRRSEGRGRLLRSHQVSHGSEDDDGSIESKLLLQQATVHRRPQAHVRKLSSL